MPEHGLFAELQDQVSGENLRYKYENLEIVNLYGSSEESLVVKKDVLDSLDLVIIDIRDVGARYYTFLTTAYYLLQKIHEYSKLRDGHKISVIIIDSPNPLGRKVEGTPLREGYESFVGVKGIPHRHGLTPGELLSYYNERDGMGVDLDICSIGELYPKKDKEATWIPPSPNIPTRQTCIVYPGQCLLEGTNLSEGRGTTKPFEIFGAPYLKIDDELLLSQLKYTKNRSFHLRPLYFQPTFHKFSGQVCGGFQIMVLDEKKFSSLLFTLQLLKILRNFYPHDFQFPEGPYEFRSDKKAIQLLAGDSQILDFLDGKLSFERLKAYFLEEEIAWERKRKDFLLY